MEYISWRFNHFYSASFLTFIVLIFSFSCLSNLSLAKESVHLQIYRTPIGQSVSVITIDPKQTQIVTAHANQHIFGRATLSQIARQHNAIAGINGGFFRMSQSNNGFPAGILKIRSQWYGIAYGNRGAIGWKNRGKPYFDRIQTKTRLFLEDQNLPFQGLNLAFGSKAHVLYSDVFGSQEIPLLPNRTAFLFNADRIEHIHTDNPDTQSKAHDLGMLTQKIPPGHFLYLTSQAFAHPEHFLGKHLQVNIDIQAEFEPQDNAIWPHLDFIVGGGPLLIKNKQLIRDFSSEQLSPDFSYRPHARSAIGVLDNGDWVFVVADQNLLNKDPGMTLGELARFMKQLGCVSALNLDGGISSSLYFQGELINSPLIEREIGDAILVLAKVQEAEPLGPLIPNQESTSNQPLLPFMTLPF